MSAALGQQVASGKLRQGELAARERQSFPDNHTAPVPQDLSRPWTTTTQHMDPRVEACPPPAPAPAAAAVVTPRIARTIRSQGACGRVGTSFVRNWLSAPERLQVNFA